MNSKSAHAAHILSCLLAEGAKQAGITFADKVAEALAPAIRENFTGSEDTLVGASAKIWEYLEAGLQPKGGGIVESFLGLFGVGTEKRRTAREIRRLIRRMSLPHSHSTPTDFAEKCLEQLLAAKRGGYLEAKITDEAAKLVAGHFAGKSADQIIAIPEQLADEVSRVLEQAGYNDLGFLFASVTRSGRELYSHLVDLTFKADLDKAPRVARDIANKIKPIPRPAEPAKPISPQPQDPVVQPAKQDTPTPKPVVQPVVSTPALPVTPPPTPVVKEPVPAPKPAVTEPVAVPVMPLVAPQVKEPVAPSIPTVTEPVVVAPPTPPATPKVPEPVVSTPPTQPVALTPPAPTPAISAARPEPVEVALDRETLDQAMEQEKARHERHTALYDETIKLLMSKGMFAKELLRSHGGTLNSEGEKKEFKELERRINEVPEVEREQMPALHNGLGKLMFAASKVPQAERIFRTLSQKLTDERMKAEVIYNTYLTELVRDRYPEALDLLKQATRTLPQRQPFPFDRFRPERILGASAVGVVFLCHDTERTKPVVIKAIRTDGVVSESQNLAREAQALFTIQHENVVIAREIFYQNNDSSRPFLVMEHFEGQPLDGYLAELRKAERRNLTPRELCELAVPLAKTLRDVHAQHRVYHRDLKPGNLLVRFEGGKWHHKLIDFGLAHILQPKGEVGLSQSGTLGYAAPEQSRQIDHEVGAYTDVFGFGRLCSYALFNNPTPDGDNWKALRDQNPQASEEADKLAQILMRCTKPTPTARYADFTGVLSELEPLLESLRKVQPLETKPKERRTKPSRRRALWDFAPPPEEGPSKARDRLKQFRQTSPADDANEVVRTYWKSMHTIKTAQGRNLQVAATFVPAGRGMTPDNYPLPGTSPEMSLDAWLSRYGGPPDWATARKLLACYRLRLPTLPEVRAAIGQAAMVPPMIPTWLREDKLRVRLSSGEVGIAPTMAENVRCLVGVRDVAETPVAAPVVGSAPVEPPQDTPDTESYVSENFAPPAG